MMQDKKITINVIESKEFRVAARGYDQREVDAFLDDICDEMERMENQMEALKRELAMAKAAPAAQARPVQQEATAGAPATDTFREILEMAQRVKEQTITEAKKQAEQIVSDAQNEITARLGNLEQEKESLTAQVDALRASAQQAREQLAALIKASQDVLDQAKEL